MTGRVKFFAVDRGYGVIEGDDGEEYLVRARHVPDGRLVRWQRVRFAITNHGDGWVAEDVELIGRQEAPHDG